MGTLLDVAGALIVRGLMYLVMLSVTASLNDTLYMKTAMNNVQGELSIIIQTLESDFQKIGYNDTTATHFTTIKSDSISFNADIDNNDTVDIVTYYVSDTSGLATSPNPLDKLLYRNVNGGVPMVIGAGITQFQMKYFNNVGFEETNPSFITSVDVLLKVEHGSYTIKDKYPSAYWQRRFYPSKINVQGY